MTNDPDVAYHEAAHLLAAYVFGVGITAASIRETADRGGVSWLHSGDAGDDPMALAVLTVAGELGERRYQGRVDRFNWMRDTHDAVHAADMVDLVAEDNGGDPMLVRRLVELKARSMLAVRWNAIEALAEALVRDTVLTGAQVERVLAGAGVRRARSGDPGHSDDPTQRDPRGRSFDPAIRRAPDGRTWAEVARAVDEKRIAGKLGPFPAMKRR